MPTATADLEWLQATDYSAVPTPVDLQSFFGIPPSPPEDLDRNIREKRKYWKSKQSKARSEEALRFSEAVLQAIDDGEDALKRGAAASGGGDAEFESATVDRAPTTVDEVWRELERLLFRGRHREALQRMEMYDAAWGSYPAFIDMRNVVILEAAQSDPSVVISPQLMDSAIAGARQVISQLGPSEVRYVTLLELLEVANRTDQIPAVFDEAFAAIANPSANFRVRRLTLSFKLQDWDSGLRTCVSLVNDAPGDRGLRSEIVQMIIARAVADLLPLDSETAVNHYRTAVAVAAWVADGVPEAEDFVRPHRMWASNSDQPVFGGNWQWRAFFALVTAFIALPLINRAAAKPAWQVVLTGPAAPGKEKKRAGKIMSQNRTWFLATRNSYVEAVHEHACLPWRSGSEWPSLDADKLFNF